MQSVVISILGDESLFLNIVQLKIVHYLVIDILIK